MQAFATTLLKIGIKLLIKNISSSLLDLNLKKRCRKPSDLALPRWLIHKLLTARTDHGDFAEYHRRLKYIDTNFECI